jgi:hypothetical protein
MLQMCQENVERKFGAKQIKNALKRSCLRIYLNIFLSQNVIETFSEMWS